MKNRGTDVRHCNVQYIVLLDACVNYIQQYAAYALYRRGVGCVHGGERGALQRLMQMQIIGIVTRNVCAV